MIRVCVDIYLYYYYTCEGIDLLADGMCLPVRSSQTDQ